jgi:hypothetical protein
MALRLLLLFVFMSSRSGADFGLGDGAGLDPHGRPRVAAIRSDEGPGLCPNGGRGSGNSGGGSGTSGSGSGSNAASGIDPNG